jgi:hypothetical protein
MKILKIFSLFLVLALSSGCGTLQNQSSGLIEPTTLIIRSELLVGTTITVGSNPPLTIIKEDLTDYKMGILGVKDRENEKLETITFEVSEGSQRVIVRDGVSVLFDKDLYIGKGQSRELRIRK